MQKLPPTQEKEKSKSVRAPAGMGTRLTNTVYERSDAAERCKALAHGRVVMLHANEDCDMA